MSNTERLAEWVAAHLQEAATKAQPPQSAAEIRDNAREAQRLHFELCYTVAGLLTGVAADVRAVEIRSSIYASFHAGSITLARMDTRGITAFLCVAGAALRLIRQTWPAPVATAGQRGQVLVMLDEYLSALRALTRRAAQEVRIPADIALAT